MTINMTPAVLLLGNVLGYYSIRAGEWRFGIALICTVYVFFLPIYIMSIMQVSTVCLDEEKICWYNFGLAWRTIAWKDVKRISFFELWSINEQRNIRVYSVDRDLRKYVLFSPKKGPVMFNDSIVDFDSLLSIVDACAKRYQIEMTKM